MDYEVEMVDGERGKRERSEIVPAEDFEFIPTFQSHVRRQNLTFGATLATSVALLLGFLLLFRGETEVAGIPEAEYENRGSDVSNGIDNQQVADAFSKLHQHQPNSDLVDWLQHHGSSGTEDNPAPQETDELSRPEVQKWLNATVTIKDGVMYEIVDTLKHSSDSFTEGLTYADGVLYESVGLNGKSSLDVLDAFTGEVLESHDLARKYFGEGLTYVDGKLVQLTWKLKTGFVYDANDLSTRPTTFTFSTTKGEGWGLTYDPTKHELIVSDGSEFLHFWDPDSKKEIRKISVTRQGGKKAHYINELEYWRGRVLANIWYEDTIICIDPDTGAVDKEYDFSSLWPQNERRKKGADVLNGISVSEDPDILYVTGKNWDRMFRVRLLP